MARRMLLATLLCLALPGSASAAEFVVTTGRDVRGGACTPTDCSLAQAIVAANQDSVRDSISFSPGLTEVEADAELPDIVAPLEVDGCSTATTSAGPCIDVTGSPTGFFRVVSRDVAFDGLAVTGAGIAINSGYAAEDLEVTDCWFGVALDGRVDGLLAGVALRAPSGLVGGLESGGNVFAHGLAGVEIEGTADEAEVLGNVFGPEATMANDFAIQFTGPSSEPIGTLIAGNLIGHTRSVGIWMPQAIDTDIIGNVIGRAPDGSPAPNSAGIYIGQQAAGTRIDDNEISHSSRDAISIEQDSVFEEPDNQVLVNVGTGNGAGPNDLFIDIGRDGPGLFPRPGLEAPVVTSLTGTSIAGTAESEASVRIFARPDNEPGNLGALLATATAGADGRWSASFVAQPAGTDVVATQTLAGQGTSELSGEPVPPPPPPQPPPPSPPPPTPPSGPVPDTILNPGGTSGVSSWPYALFAFRSNLRASFECSIDGGPFRACESARQIGPLTEGTHTFAVRARTSAGVVDPTPATRTFAIDTIEPDTFVFRRPAALSRDATPDFRVGSNEPGGGVLCRLGSRGGRLCSNLGRLRDGLHTVSVQAHDTAGNFDSSPTVITFRIDTSSPRIGLGTPRRGHAALLTPLSCPRTEASGSCRVRLVIQQGRKVLGRPTARVRAGRTTLVRLRMRRPPRKGTRLTVAHTTTDAAGNRRSATARVRVR